MLRSIISIALLHVKLITSEHRVFFFSLVMPIIFTAVMARATLTGFGNSPVLIAQIEVVTADHGILGRSLIASLQADTRWKIHETNFDESVRQVKEGQSVCILTIPRNFTESVFNRQSASLDLYAGNGSPSQFREAQDFINGVVYKVIDSLFALEISDLLVKQLEEKRSGKSQLEMATPHIEKSFSEVTKTLENIPSITIRREPEINTVVDGKDSGANQSSPGVIVMFAMLFAVGGANILIFERNLGTLRRLLITPNSKITILFGKLVGIYLIGIVQISLMILSGILLFGVSWGNSLGALSLMVMAYVLVTTSMGVLLATVVKTVAQADTLASLVVMALSALGGAWWSLSVTPQWMRILGHLFPTAWAMDGFKNIIIGHQSIAGILPELIVLLGFAIFFMTIGLLRFRYQ